MSDPEPVDLERGERERSEKELAIAAGLNDAEADCWVQAAEVARMFFRLEALHPSDKQEVASAIHVIQDKLIGRPAYRKYITLRDGKRS